MDYILYHANCQDGWVAAYIAKKKWPDAALMPLSYGMTLEKLDSVFRAVRQKDVIMVDYSFPTREAMEELARVTKSLRVYDHHISKKEVLAGFDFAVFDNARSGAGLAWDYLFGKDSGPKTMYREHSEGEWTDVYGVEGELPRPWWVNYTEDQDLWKWTLPHGRTINSYLMIQERSIERWKEIETITDPMSIFAHGIGAQQRTEFDVGQLFNTVQEGVFHGYRTGVVNTSVAVSEVGQTIYESGYDIALSWYERADGRVSFGLRSNVADVGDLAKKYGGGGHKASAGFEADIQRAREIIDSVLGRKEEIEVYGSYNRCC